MSEDNSLQLLLSQQFSSFEEFAEMVVAWNLDIRQVSKSDSTHHVKQIQAGNIFFRVPPTVVSRNQMVKHPQICVPSACRM